MGRGDREGETRKGRPGRGDWEGGTGKGRPGRGDREGGTRSIVVTNFLYLLNIENFFIISFFGFSDNRKHFLKVSLSFVKS